MTATKIEQATEIIADAIRALTPDFWDGKKDQAGQSVNIHLNDGNYAATINWETRAWCDYEILDGFQEKLEDAGLPYTADYLSDYEICLDWTGNCTGCGIRVQNAGALQTCGACQKAGVA